MEFICEYSHIGILHLYLSKIECRDFFYYNIYKEVSGIIHMSTSIVYAN